MNPLLPLRARVEAFAERPPPPAPELIEQLQYLLHVVWLCERNWRFDDRLDMALRLGQITPRRKP